MSIPAASATEAHAHAMDRIYRWQRHIYDPTRKYYLIGRDDLIDGLDAGPGKTVLELGCGTGRNLIVAAGRHPGARFYGIDISSQMLASAKASAARAGFDGRIRTALGDAASVDASKRFAVMGFDRILLPYCLSMIPDWQGTIANAIAQTAPGGSVHIVDFGQMGRWPGMPRIAMRFWLSQFKVEPRHDLAGVAERLGTKAGFDVQTKCLLGGYAWTIVLRRPAKTNEPPASPKTGKMKRLERLS